MFSRSSHDPLPQGIRISTLHKTEHCFAQTKEIVQVYLEKPTSENWDIYVKKYIALLEHRFIERRKEFEEIADLAMNNNVFIGCYCPTKKNPDVYRCHTVLALKFMKDKYPDLIVKLP